MSLSFVFRFVGWRPSPHGEGGLKCGNNDNFRRRMESLPTRGGWIEMIASDPKDYNHSRPSPHGEGGLKYRPGPCQPGLRGCPSPKIVILNEYK